MRLDLTPEEMQRFLDGEMPLSERIFLACVDILFESGGEAVKNPPERD